MSLICTANVGRAQQDEQKRAQAMALDALLFQEAVKKPKKKEGVRHTRHTRFAPHMPYALRATHAIRASRAAHVMRADAAPLSRLRLGHRQTCRSCLVALDTAAVPLAARISQPLP
eukprot:502804-Pleurochrysis_carterae.AAC.4